MDKKKSHIQYFQIVFLLVIYTIGFAFFHMFPEPSTAASSISRRQANTVNVAGRRTATTNSKPRELLPTLIPGL